MHHTLTLCTSTPQVYPKLGKGEASQGDKLGLLQGPCKKDCANISGLPIYDMTLPRYLSQHGSLGRGSAEGAADCRHYCNNMVDQWSILLYNAVC